MKKSWVLLIVSIVVVLLVVFLPDGNQQGKSITIDGVGKTIDRVMIQNNGESFEILKNQDWSVHGKIKYLADAAMVKEILQEFETPKLAEWISGSEVYDQYGLGDKRKISVTYWMGDSEKLSVQIGRVGNRSQSYYLLIEGDKNVYQTTGLKRVFDVSELDIRNSIITKIVPDSINSIEIKKGRKYWKLVKEKLNNTNLSPSTENLPSLWTDGKGSHYRNVLVNDIVNTLEKFEAIGFDDRNTKQIKNSLAIIKINTISETYLINIHEKIESAYIVTLDGKDIIFKISELDGERLIKKPVLEKK